MFTPYIRLVLIIISLIIAFLFYLKADYFNMVFSLLPAVLFIYGYFKYGTVYAAFQQLKEENFKKAEELISKVKSPEKLTKGHKSYYHFTIGIIASSKQDWDKSFSELTKALNIGLRTKNDTTIVLLNLANVELERKNFSEAIEFVKEIRKFDLNPIVDSETNRIENEINLAIQKL